MRRKSSRVLLPVIPFKHVTSSSRDLQYNGAVGGVVQTIKTMLKKESGPYLALLGYRSSPLETGEHPTSRAADESEVEDYNTSNS